MNPAITAALVAANRQSEAPTPVQRLTKVGALSSDKAIAIDPGSAAECKQLDAAMKLGLIQRRADGRYYVNQRAVDERNARIGYVVLLTLLILASTFASAITLLTFVAR